MTQAPEVFFIDAGTDQFWVDMRDVIFANDRLENARAEVSDALARVQLSAPAKVLDVGCGIGRHSHALAYLGYDATGIDQVAPYIAQAQETAISGLSKPNFIAADIAGYDGLNAGSFDAAICLYHSLGYDQEPDSDLQILQRIRACLKPGAALVLDLIDPEGFSPNEYRKAKLDTEKGPVDRTVSVNAERNEYEITFTFANMPTLCYRAKHRLFSTHRMTGMLKQAGFDFVDVDSPLTCSYAKGSRRLAFVASVAK